MRQDFVGRRNPGSRFSRIVRRPAPALSVTVLILLAIPALLPAQSAEHQAVVPQELGQKVERLKANGFYASDLDLGFGALPTSIAALDEMRPTTRLSSGVASVTSSAAVASLCAATSSCADWFLPAERSSHPLFPQPNPAADDDKHAEGSKSPSVVQVRNSKPPDLNRSIYYKNKLEFSLDGGWLPINIPFVFDVFLGDAYNRAPLNYTLVPIIASLRWQMDDVGGPWILRGNWDLTTSAAITVIPRGPESHYIAWIMGIRRNFVPRHGRIAPYFDGRLGLGGIDAKEPAGVLYAQGQDFTFTVNMGSGVRYNFNPRYSISAGLNWMHISNLYLSEPKFSNYGINVYGPMFGINVTLGRPRLHGTE